MTSRQGDAVLTEPVGAPCEPRGPLAGFARPQTILWSLIASAQRHEIDVQLYLRSVLAHLTDLPPDELPNYLPDVWKRHLLAEQRAEAGAHHAKLARATIR
jgi:hypothetical protein